MENKGKLKGNKGKLNGNRRKLKRNLSKFLFLRKIPKIPENGKF